MGARLAKQIESLNVPGFVKFYLVHLASRVVAFWLPNILLACLHVTKLGKRWKIQGEKMPSWKLIKEALTHNVAVDAVTYWAVSFVFHRLLTLNRSKKAKQIKEDGETEAVEVTTEHVGVKKGSNEKHDNGHSGGKGWSFLRFKGPAPNWWTQTWMVAFGYFGYDAMFYWSHRLLHHPRIYKYVHKKHHQFHTPVGPSCAYEHIVEGVAQMLNWYVPMGIAGWLNGDLHSSTLFYYHCFRWIETVDAHSGYEFPFSPFHVLPIFGGARMHDYHHRAFNGNFGASVFWDWFCGTDKGFWEEVLEDGLLKGGKRFLLSK